MNPWRCARQIAKITPSAHHPVTVRSAKEAAEQAASIGTKARLVEDDVVAKLVAPRSAVTTITPAGTSRSITQQRIRAEQQAPLNVLNRELAEATARRIPGARFTLMRGLGHFPMAEDPERFLGVAPLTAAGDRWNVTVVGDSDRYGRVAARDSARKAPAFHDGGCRRRGRSM